MVHMENNRFEIDSNWSGRTIAISSSSINTVSSNFKQSDLITQFRVESLTGEILFELNQNFTIDRKTRVNIEGQSDEQGNASILFPPNPTKKDIFFWPIEMGAPTTLVFTGIEKINDLTVYHYQTKNAVINDTAGFVDLPLVPEKYKALSRVNIDVYVEPKTGTIINHEDSGVSYYANDNNEVVWDMDQWSNKYNEPTIADRVKEARSKINKFLVIEWVIPIVFVVSGITLFATGLLKKRK